MWRMGVWWRCVGGQTGSAPENRSGGRSKAAMHRANGLLFVVTSRWRGSGRYKRAWRRCWHVDRTSDNLCHVVLIMWRAGGGILTLGHIFGGIPQRGISSLMLKRLYISRKGFSLSLSKNIKRTNALASRSPSWIGGAASIAARQNMAWHVSISPGERQAAEKAYHLYQRNIYSCSHVTNKQWTNDSTRACRHKHAHKTHISSRARRHGRGARARLKKSGGSKHRRPNSFRHTRSFFATSRVSRGRRHRRRPNLA